MYQNALATHNRRINPPIEDLRQAEIIDMNEQASVGPRRNVPTPTKDDDLMQRVQNRLNVVTKIVCVLGFMFLVLLITTITLHSQTQPQQSLSRGYCPVSFVGKCFWFSPRSHNYQMNFPEATEMCADLGGKPANIYSEEHGNMIVQYLRAFGGNIYPYYRDNEWVNHGYIYPHYGDNERVKRYLMKVWLGTINYYELSELASPSYRPRARFVIWRPMYEVNGKTLLGERKSIHSSKDIVIKTRGVLCEK